MPNANEMEAVNRVIYEELVKGTIKDESRGLVKAVMERLVDEGAQGVILGCTELPLLIGQKDLTVPVFDTTRIHAKRR